MPQNKTTHKKRLKEQAGNVFIIILAGIFLFGALMFTFSKSGQKGSGNLTKHQAKIAAQEILNYARLVEGAVDRVRRNGCSENEISFVNAVVSGYSNANAPVDGSCDVFGDSGGKVSYQTPPETILDKSSSSGTNYKTYYFTGRNMAPYVGSNTIDELIVFLHFLNKNICIEINNALSITNPSNNPPDEISGICNGTKYTGNFGPGTCGIDSLPEIDNKTSACIKTLASGDSSYSFYHVLLAR